MGMALTAVGLTTPSAAHADPMVAGTYAVSSVGTNNQITPGPDGNMWVTLDGGTTEVARITSAGVVTEFDLPGAANAVGITSAADRLWVTYPGGVANFSTTDPSGTVTTTPIAAIADPRIMTVGPDGNVWTASNDKVVRIPPSNPGTATTFPGTGVTGARAIASGSGALWVADFGGAQVVRVGTDGVGTSFPTGGGPQGVAATPAGVVAVANPGTNPQTVATLPPLAGVAVPNTDPFGATYAADGAFWIAQFLTDGLARLTAAGAVTTPVTFPAGSGPRQVSAGPGNTVWATLDTSNRVAQISGVAPPPAPTPSPTPTPTPTSPKTIISKAPPKKVTTRKARTTLVFRFRSEPPGGQFTCRLSRRGKSLPPWRGCTSPKRYTVKSGHRYTFRVRAAEGPLDPTPATRTVRVVRAR